jgi:predicted membrane-bound spermidine synthase
MHKHRSIFNKTDAVFALFIIFFISGFTALLYQVVWQRMLGLFSGSDVRSVTIVVASYLLGLGIGSLLGGIWSDHLSSRKAVQIYGLCNLGIAVFAIFSRFLFYDLLFLRLSLVAQSTEWTLLIVFLSLLIPTTLIGGSLPLLSRAISQSVDQAAPQIGWLYGVNTLGAGVGTLMSGWFIVGTLGYEWTVYLGAVLSLVVGLIALSIAHQFNAALPLQKSRDLELPQATGQLVVEWCVLVFLSGFVAISLEIIWFRVLDTLLQSIAYTYAHLLAFILISNALGSMVGGAIVPAIRTPRQVFLWIQGGVVTYSLMAIWLISLYWQAHPTDLRSELGYIDPANINSAVVFRYFVVPLGMMAVPSFLLGLNVPLVQKAVQTDVQQIGKRVGLIQLANIVGNTTGSLLTGLVLLEVVGTADSLRFLALIGLGFVLLNRFYWIRASITGLLAIVLTVLIVVFPSNSRFWSALHGIQPQTYFKMAEDSTGIAAVTEANQQGTLLASGQAQARFPYMLIHALLGSLPALMHPHPAQVMIVGLGSGGTAHTIGVNPSTQQVQVIELLGAEITVLREYSKTVIGKPLSFLFQDPRYQFVVSDGRRELALSKQKFDIIEADAIYPWRSRAGMLYSEEFFREVQSHLSDGGLFVEWNVGLGTEQTFRSVFPYVMELSLSGDLYVLVGSNYPIAFNRQSLLDQLNRPDVIKYLVQAGVDVAAIRDNVKTAGVAIYSHAKDGRPKAINTDLFPRSEYYLNSAF